MGSSIHHISGVVFLEKVSDDLVYYTIDFLSFVLAVTIDARLEAYIPSFLLQLNIFIHHEAHALYQSLP